MSDGTNFTTLTLTQTPAILPTTLYNQHLRIDYADLHENPYSSTLKGIRAFTESQSRKRRRPNIRLQRRPLKRHVRSLHQGAGEPFRGTEDLGPRL